MTYNNLGVFFDSLYYESDTYLLGKDIVKEGLSKEIFYKILDKWYNPELFEQDNHGVWHPKFKVGI